MTNLAQRVKDELRNHPVNITEIRKLLDEAKGKRFVIDLSKLGSVPSHEQFIYMCSMLDFDIINTEDETQR